MIATAAIALFAALIGLAFVVRHEPPDTRFDFWLVWCTAGTAFIGLPAYGTALAAAAAITGDYPPAPAAASHALTAAAGIWACAAAWAYERKRAIDAAFTARCKRLRARPFVLDYHIADAVRAADNAAGVLVFRRGGPERFVPGRLNDGQRQALVAWAYADLLDCLGR